MTTYGRRRVHGRERFEMKELVLELSRRCPLRCVICSTDAGPSHQDELGMDEFTDILSQAAALGCESVSFSGGEPLMHPELLALCHVCRTHGMRTSVYSCGNVMGNSGVCSAPAQTLDELASAGLARVVFSVHGADACVHDETTGVAGSFANMLLAVDRAKSLGIATEFHFVPTKINYMVLGDLVALAKEHGVTVISLLRFVPQGRGRLHREELELSAQDTRVLRDQIEPLINDPGIRLRIGAHYSCLELGGGSRCLAGLEKAAMTPDGYVVPCSGMKEIWRLGPASSVKRSTLRSIWLESEPFQRTRELLLEPEAAGCGDCARFWQCRDGCLTQRLLASAECRPSAEPLCVSGMGRPEGPDRPVLRSVHQSADA